MLKIQNQLNKTTKITDKYKWSFSESKLAKNYVNCMHNFENTIIKYKNFTQHIKNTE